VLPATGRPAAAPGSNTHAFQTSRGLSARLNRSGGVDFVDARGRKPFAFAAPYMYDSSRTSAGYSRKVRYSLIPTTTGYVRRLTADRAWLSSPARKWPVLIDPTMTLNPEQDCFMTGGASAKRFRKRSDSG